MGKKGAALRAAKAQSTTYTFTKEQLEEHDRHVLDTYRERVIGKVVKRAEEYDEVRKKELNEYIEEEWKKREELFRNNHDGLMNTLSLLACCSSRVLIEKFHWKPIPKDGNYDRRNQTVRFADCLVQEINKICEDENADIRRYCEETYELYGVKFTAEEDDANGD